MNSTWMKLCFEAHKFIDLLITNNLNFSEWTNKSFLTFDWTIFKQNNLENDLATMIKNRKLHNVTDK